MGSYILALVAGRYLFRHDLRTSTMQALVCAYPDMAYFGAPILAAMFGASGFLAVLVGNLITSIIMIPLTMILLRVSGKREAGHGWEDAVHILSSSLLNAFKSPIVCLPLAGAVPTATAAAMFALRNKTYTAQATATIFISTLLGLVTEGPLIAFLRS